MSRSFGLVDEKLAEADFFLDKINESKLGPFEVRCFASAFISSARSVTYALQAVMKPVPDFSDWYSRQQEALRDDSTARFFLSFRNENIHKGINVVGGGTYGRGQPPLHWFYPTDDIREVPNEDLISACRRYMTILAQLVYDCYIDFGPIIDPHQYYTAEHYASIGKTVDDADEDVFGIRGWTFVSGFPEDYRWQVIRDSVPGIEIGFIFEKYLAKDIPRPDRLPSIADKDDK